MNLPIDPEILKMRANLPRKLTQLSHIDPDLALRLLRDWGEGRKAITQLWDATMTALHEKEEVSA